ncbi:hypothetical protein SARC_09217, partial [Sphaeroforma arctica JP610]
LQVKECVLQGSILPAVIEDFLSRCEGLIGFRRTSLRYDEYVYTFPNGVSINKLSVPFRARHHNPESKLQQWDLRYVGPTEIKIPIRSVINLERSADDPRAWLTDTGHVFDYCYSVTGYCFYLKGVSLSIYRAYKMSASSRPSLTPNNLLNESFFVELTSQCTPATSQETLANLSAFAEKLAPTVYLEPVAYNQLQKPTTQTSATRTKSTTKL